MKLYMLLVMMAFFTLACSQSKSDNPTPSNPLALQTPESRSGDPSTNSLTDTGKNSSANKVADKSAPKRQLNQPTNFETVTKEEFELITSYFGMEPIRCEVHERECFKWVVMPNSAAAIQKTDTLLNGRAIPSELLKNFFNQLYVYALANEKHEALMDNPKSGDVIANFILKLTQLKVPVNFSNDNYLGALINPINRTYGSTINGLALNSEKVFDALIKVGQDPNQCGFLIKVALFHNLELLKKYISLGVNVDQMSCNGLNTPLSMMLLGGQKNIGKDEVKYFNSFWDDGLVVQDNETVEYKKKQKEIVLFLYKNGADLLRNNSSMIRDYLSMYIHNSVMGFATGSVLENSVRPILKDLFLIRPFDITPLAESIEDMYPLGKFNEFWYNNLMNISIGSLQEIAELGLDISHVAKSPLWVFIKSFDSVTVTEKTQKVKRTFAKLLFNLHADLNYAENGKSIVGLLKDQNDSELVVAFCKKGVIDSICDSEL